MMGFIRDDSLDSFLLNKDQYSVYRSLNDDVNVVAAAESGTTVFYLTDKHGKRLTDQQFLGICGKIDQGIVLVVTKDGYGLFHLDNGWIVKPCDYFLGIPREDRIYAYDDERDLWCFLNYKGDRVTEWIPAFDYLSPTYSKGICSYRTPDGAVNVVDKKFAKLFSINNAMTIDPFNGLGLARTQVRNQDGVFQGFIAMDGEWVIKPVYASLGYFREGLAPASFASGWTVNGIGSWNFSKERDDIPEAKKKWGFIDRFGKTIIQHKYDRVYHFSDGLAAVCVNGLWGYIDTKGNEIIKPQYLEADRFQNGYAMVRKKKSSDNQRSLIDKKGKVLLDFELPER